MEWTLYIFRCGRNTYLVNGESEDDAWNQLQLKLSRNMIHVKQQSKLIHTMNASSSEVFKIKKI